MANVSALLMIALLLCSTLMCTARPNPSLSVSITTASGEPCNLVSLIPHAIDPISEKKIEAGLNDVAEENCGADDEDCLLRRSLVAHVDYIYTQKQKNL